MDEIVQQFENTLGQEKEDESYKTLYKNWGKFGNQEQRRNDILQQQKSDRRNNLDTCRGIFQLIENTQQSSVFKKYQMLGLWIDMNVPIKEILDCMMGTCKSSYRPNVYVPGFTRSSKLLADILMHSEWLIERPEDFSTNWYVTPCPSGTRMLVVASNGLTKCYTKYGQFRFEITTLLPGGNFQEKKKNCSVLDCFYHRDSNIMYVLDILTWNNHIMADGEMEFRHFWLQTKFEERPQLTRFSKRNKVIFSLLPMIPCDDESFQKFMMTYPPLASTKLDGLLFYHKHGRYVAGETPLVGWLFPFMVPEVLGYGDTDIQIHPSYAAGKPHDYTNQADYIQKFEAKMRKKSFGKGNKKNGNSQDSSSDSKMEAEDTPVVPKVESNVMEDEEILDRHEKKDTSENENKKDDKDKMDSADKMEDTNKMDAIDKVEDTDSKAPKDEPVKMDAEAAAAPAAGPSTDTTQVTENTA